MNCFQPNQWLDQQPNQQPDQGMTNILTCDPTNTTTNGPTHLTTHKKVWFNPGPSFSLFTTKLTLCATCSYYFILHDPSEENLPEGYWMGNERIRWLSKIIPKKQTLRNIKDKQC